MSSKCKTCRGLMFSKNAEFCSDDCKDAWALGPNAVRECRRNAREQRQAATEAAKTGWKWECPECKWNGRYTLVPNTSPSVFCSVECRDAKQSRLDAYNAERDAKKRQTKASNRKDLENFVAERAAENRVEPEEVEPATQPDQPEAEWEPPF